MALCLCLLDDWGGHHWLLQSSHRGLESILFTWPGGVISSDSLPFLMSLYVYYVLTLGTYSNPDLSSVGQQSLFWHECVLLPPRVSGMVSNKCACSALPPKSSFWVFSKQWREDRIYVSELVKNVILSLMKVAEGCQNVWNMWLFWLVCTNLNHVKILTLSMNKSAGFNFAPHVWLMHVHVVGCRYVG